MDQDLGLVKIERALISVSDKSGIIPFAQGLVRHGVEIISTGGTAKELREAGLTIRDVSDVTGFPECLNGRVKTLHPILLGGILADRNNQDHIKTAMEMGMCPIDMVVVNLYPFEATVAKPTATLEEAIENIDIGGPTMIRAAAKNFQDVAVVVDPKDYPLIQDEMERSNGSLCLRTRYKLAVRVWELTAEYDAVIHGYMLGHAAPE